MIMVMMKRRKRRIMMMMSIAEGVNNVCKNFEQVHAKGYVLRINGQQNWEICLTSRVWLPTAKCDACWILLVLILKINVLYAQAGQMCFIVQETFNPVLADPKSGGYSSCLQKGLLGH